MSSSLMVVVPVGKLEEIEQLLSTNKQAEYGGDDNKTIVVQEQDILKRGMAALQNEFAELHLEGEKIAKEILNSDKNYSLNELEMFAQEQLLLQLEPFFTRDKEEIEVLAANLEESSIKVSQLKANYESALHERDVIQEELTLSEHRITETKAMLQKTEDANNEIEKDMEAMKSEFLKYQAHMENTMGQIENLKVELEEERSKVAKLNVELARAKSSNGEVHKSVGRDEKDSTNEEKNIDELRAFVGEYETKTESLHNEVSKLQAMIEESELEKKELQQEVLDAQKRVSDATTDNIQTAEEIKKLSLEIQEFYKRLSELQACYNECQHERSDFQGQTMALQQEVIKLQAELVETNSAHQRRMATLGEGNQNLTIIGRLTLRIRSKLAGAFLGVFAF